MSNQNRAGHFIPQPGGHKIFIPKPLPPSPRLEMDSAMVKLVSRANLNLGRLDGIIETLPNPSLFLAMFIKKEALLSSQIEGTQASLIDILEGEANATNSENVNEVYNYIRAMNHGLHRLKELPLSLRLIREIHSILLHETRGSLRSPGEFRSSQNWIGADGAKINAASFVPPSVPEMHIALNDLETYLHQDDDMPDLIRIALIHAQFETIHPFLDGNGRIGRLLITFWLCEREILSQPLLYLSIFFKRNRREYYDRLTSIRENGAWEDWVKFFLKGIIEVSHEAVETAKKILQLKESCQQNISTLTTTQGNCQQLLDHLFDISFITVKEAAEFLGVSRPTAKKCIDDLVFLGILTAEPNRQRGVRYLFDSYVLLMKEGTEV